MRWRSGTFIPFFYSLVLFALSSTESVYGKASRNPSDTPNLLLIITDEHNFRTLGCYRKLLSVDQAQMWGPDCFVETPHIDRLASEGVICTRAYATSPVCSPCRAAMITGYYPHQVGVSTNNQILNEGAVTLADVLGEAGYRTGFIGKWHLAGEDKPGWSPRVNGGFEDTKFMFNRGHWKKFRLNGDQPEIAAKDNKGRPSYDLNGADETSFATDYLTDQAISFVRSTGDSPFLLVLSLPDPHGPNTVRPPYDHMYDHLRFLPPRTYGRDDLLSPRWLGEGKNHAVFRGEQMSRYFGMVKCIDDNIGRLLNVLQAEQESDSTIVLLTSDHGDLCYEHDRLNKGNPYEGSARVPLLLRYPQGDLNQAVFDSAIGTVDITPTLLGLAGCKVKREFPGRDLSSYFRGAVHEANSEIVFLRNSGLEANWVAAVDSRYKLILSVSDRPWLFDNEEDPDELFNFYQRPNTNGVVRRLAKGLQKYSLESKDPYFKNAKIIRSLNQCLQ